MTRWTPQNLRGAVESLPRVRRGGLDSEAVESLLSEVAAQLHELYAENVRLHEENARVKGALSEWQTQQAKARAIDAEDYPTGEYSQVTRRHFPQQNGGGHHRDYQGRAWNG
jgi:hypothetical protein